MSYHRAHFLLEEIQQYKLPAFNERLTRTIRISFMKWEPYWARHPLSILDIPRWKSNNTCSLQAPNRGLNRPLWTVLQRQFWRIELAPNQWILVLAARSKWHLFEDKMEWTPPDFQLQQLKELFIARSRPYPIDVSQIYFRAPRKAETLRSIAT